MVSSVVGVVVMGVETVVVEVVVQFVMAAVVEMVQGRIQKIQKEGAETTPPG